METSIGLKILIALKEAKINQYELAEKLATSHSLVSKWVNDSVVPNKTSMEKLAETLKKPIQYFMKGSIDTGIIPEYDDFEPLSGLREVGSEEYKAWELIYNDSTDGYTRASLSMLRDVLVKLFRSKICAVELEIEGVAMVPLNGFLVIDMNEKKAYWSGDGFGRHSGTGHRGYKAAHDLLCALGVGINFWPKKIVLEDNGNDRSEFKKMLIDIAKEVFSEHKDWFGVPITKWPIF